MTSCLLRLISSMSIYRSWLALRSGALRAGAARVESARAAWSFMRNVQKGFLRGAAVRFVGRGTLSDVARRRYGRRLSANEEHRAHNPEHATEKPRSNREAAI